MSEPLKKILQIENLEIKISNDSSIPHVILNGVDYERTFKKDIANRKSRN
nr:MAG TPA: hypothetical protein [Caudoviricetes sp.]